jgi:Transposase IS66 family
MSGTIGRSPAPTRPQRCSSTRATATASTPTGISPATPGSSRLMLMPALAISTMPGAGPITEAACWSHGRRKFFVLADLGKSPLALEAVRRIDEVFAIEREINGIAAEQRLAVRQERIRPLVGELEGWMRAERARLSRHADIAKAMDYMLKRWPAFTRVLDDGRICLSNNAVERALRGIALGRRAWLFAGSDRGAERAAATYTLIGSANSTVSIRRRRLPTCCAVSPTIRLPSCTRCCPGIGNYTKSPPLPPDYLSSRPRPDAYDRPPRPCSSGRSFPVPRTYNPNEHRYRARFC